MTDKTSVIILIVAIVIFSLIIYSLINSRFGTNYQSAIASENPLDKCKTPQGYTDQEWREHMGHHPDKYRECL